MTGSRYAEGTSVTPDRSQAEIQRTLERFGATGFMFGQQQNAALVEFVARDRRVRFIIPMPNRDSAAFTHTPTSGKRRTPQAAAEAYRQGVRERWRALAMVVKAKLVVVDSGILTFDEEFAAHLVLPGGATVGEYILPRIEQAYETGEVPELLPSYEARPALESGQ